MWHDLKICAKCQVFLKRAPINAVVKSRAKHIVCEATTYY